MKKTILVVAAATGMSLLAVAQSDKKPADNNKQSHEVTSPRDAASGQASGKKGSYDVKKMEGAIQDSSNSNNAREVSTGKATGKMQNVSADESSQAVSSSSNDQKATEHSVKSPRDAASGLATGKRRRERRPGWTAQTAVGPRTP